MRAATVYSYAIVVLMAAAVPSFAQPMPPVQLPPENPVTEEKRILGKILFWDVQLSSDNTTSCGTCHSTAGADTRLAANPGFDLFFGTDDDVSGSAGVVRRDASGAFMPDPDFGFEPQVTPRTANSVIMAAFFFETFWDGRALGTFVDPLSGETLIPFSGALESQAVVPPLSSVEMAHEGRTWSQVTGKLAGVRPLALATDVPPDMAAALGVSPTYPDLFADAFGDGDITPSRIAFAIATYERTLIADQTPFDMGTMTPTQSAGFNVFNSNASARCNFCHTPPLFTDRSFRNIGLRPWEEDAGLMDTTGFFLDRGLFKTPNIRNVGLKTTFMHTGVLTSLDEVLDFYTQTNGQTHFLDNTDSLVEEINLSTNQRVQLLDFLENGLTDPRVAAESFPFDRPTLHSELPANPTSFGAGVAGTSGLTPQLIITSPPNVGNDAFAIGVYDALGGATAHVAVSETPPGPDGLLSTAQLSGPITLEGAGGGAGYGTFAWPIPDDERLRGKDVYFQWRIADAAAPDGLATTAVAQASIYVDDPTECDCFADFDCNGSIAFDDLLIVLATWGSAGGEPDVDGSGTVDFGDVVLVLGFWGPCP